MSTSEIGKKNNNNSYTGNYQGHNDYSRAHSLIQLDYEKVKEALAKPEVEFEN